MHAMQVKRVAFGVANVCGCRHRASSRADRPLWRPDDAISRQSRGQARGLEAFSQNVKQQGKERVPIAQRVVTTVISATDIPYSFYVPYPRTLLHDVDARVKQLWVIAVCVMFPFLNDAARVGFSLWLAGVTMALIPFRTWWPQLKGLAFLCGLSMLFTMTGADGVKANFQSRIPPAGFGLDLPPLPPTAYRFELMNIFFIVVTRKSVNLAVMAGTLIFSTLQATSLCLVTTPPEQLARGLRWFMTPLEIVKFPVKEFEMVLLLSLRFVSVVFTELRNLCLGLAARGVNWKALGTIGVFDVMINLMSRLFSNLLAQCSTMAEAMSAMGFTTPEEQKLYLLSKHRGSAFATLICAALLVAFCSLPVLLKLL